MMERGEPCSGAQWRTASGPSASLCFPNRYWWVDIRKGSSKSGTFLIDSGLLAVGVGIDGPKTELDVLGPRKWFRQRAGWEPTKD